MKKLFYSVLILFCACAAAAQNIELPPGITGMNINVEIMANIAVTRYDIAVSGAQGTRRMQIAKEEKLKKEDGGYVYTLPLEYAEKIQSLNLRIDIIKQDAAPEIKENPLADFNFTKRDDSYTAAFKATDYKPQGSLIFTYNLL